MNDTQVEPYKLMRVSMPSDQIGVVVIGRNEGGRLIRCLTSIAPAANKIVYVDSGSTDGSPAAAEKMGISVVRLDMARPFTAARARNEGLAALKAQWPDLQYVQFIDGDCELVSGWLDTASTFMQQRKDVAIACGRRREIHPGRSVYNRLCDMEWDTPVGQTLACGGDSLVRVAAFEAVGGFRSQLIAGEEPEFCVRLRENGWAIWRLDAEMTGHDADIMHFRQWWIRAVRTGYGYTEVVWLHRHSPYGIWKREIRSAIFWGGLVPLVIAFGALVHPAALIGVLIYPLQICRMALRWKAATVDRWVSSLFILLAQFAAVRGILKYCWHRWRNATTSLIEYKQAG